GHMCEVQTLLLACRCERKARSLVAAPGKPLTPHRGGQRRTGAIRGGEQVECPRQRINAERGELARERQETPLGLAGRRRCRRHRTYLAAAAWLATLFATRLATFHYA